MSGKLCGKCSKTVYPTEQLQCLDKYWHKGCFKCEVCNMTLTMKNYKGYNKTPYCNAHYPTTKHTVVADTPENRRIAENTKIQSNVKYHAEFERQKGTKHSVVDDPETARIKKNTENQSNVSYWGVREQRTAMESRRPNEVVDDVMARRQPGKISDYDPAADHQPSPYSQRSSANVVYDSQKGGHGTHLQGQRVQPGSIADYDPMNERHSSIVGKSQSQPHHGGGGGYQQQQQQQQQHHQPPPPQQQHQPPPPQQQPPQQPPPPQQQKQQPQQVRYRAMYDYTAADDDEVSFNEGDFITNCEIIDAGWMTGVVMRTGQHGMLPSNYVERV